MQLIQTGDLVVIVVDTGHYLLDGSPYFTENETYQVLEGQDKIDDMIQLEDDIGVEWWVYPDAVELVTRIKKIYAKELD